MVDISRRTFVKGLAAGLIPAGAAAAWLTIDDSGADAPASTPTTAPKQAGQTQPAASIATPSTNWVADENMRPGTIDWKIVPSQFEGVSGYAGVTTARHGDEVTLFIDADADSFTVEAFRMGHYQGLDGRSVWKSDEQSAKRQAEPDREGETNTIIARWDPSLRVGIGDDWPPGSYLFKVATNRDAACHIPLTVTDDDSRAALLIVNSNTTWQAYNNWGGYNLYYGPGENKSTRATVVSFDRPFHSDGATDFLSMELPLVGLVEELGMDVMYVTDVDLHENPDLVHRHRGIVSLGHDEYYSNEMRGTLEDARARGVNIAFLGANAVYRKIRFEESDLGDFRRMVNYRSTADPITSSDPEQATVEWRSSPASRPERDLIGIQYECPSTNGDMVVADADAWQFEGTDLQNGDKLRQLVGPEYDRIYPGGETPDNLHVLADSPVMCLGSRPARSHMTYYTASSGAGIWATGTNKWISGMRDAECMGGTKPEGTSAATRKITENVLRVFAAGPAGKTHPSESNLDEITVGTPGTQSA